MAHSGVLYIFERRRGPKRHGARGNLLPSPLSTGLPMFFEVPTCKLPDRGWTLPFGPSVTLKFIS